MASADWPYGELPTSPQTAFSTPRWDCVQGLCVCHAPDGTPVTVEHTLRFFDAEAKRMPGARCRIFEGGQLVNEGTPNADGLGELRVMLRPTTETLLVEWAPAHLPLAPPFPLRCHYFVKPGKTQDAGVTRRLSNLGYSGSTTLADNVRAFQRDYALPPTGRPGDIAALLSGFHDGGLLPPRIRPPIVPLNDVQLPVPDSPFTMMGTNETLPAGCVSVVWLNLRLRVFDSARRGLAQAQIRLHIEGLGERTGEADDRGVLELPGIPHRARAMIYWGPPSPSIDTASELPFRRPLKLDYPIEEPHQRDLTRLRHLGYAPTQSLHDAVRSFKRDYGLAPINSELDEPTRAQLAHIHDELVAAPEHSANAVSATASGVPKAGQSAALVGGSPGAGGLASLGLGTGLLNVPAATAHRLRLSVYATMNLMAHNSGIEKITKAARGVIDDISILDLMINSADMTRVVPDTKLIGKSWKPLANACALRRVQLFAGYALTANSTRSNAFIDWIYGLKHTSVSIQSFAAKIKAFMRNELGSGAHGLSFDIETIFQFKRKQGSIAVARKRLTEFYRAVAKELSTQTVAIIVPALVNDQLSPGLDASGKPQGPKVPERGIADYHGIVAGLDNVILRPMGYDYFTGAQPPSSEYINRYHEGAMKHIVTNKKVPPSAFQMAIKVVGPGQGNTTPKQELITSAKGKRMKRTIELAHQFDTGIIMFAANSMLSEWHHVDKLLNRNRGALEAGRVGDPKQVPVPRRFIDPFIDF